METVAKCMELEIIVLDESRETQTNTTFFSYM